MLKPDSDVKTTQAYIDSKPGRVAFVRYKKPLVEKGSHPLWQAGIMNPAVYQNSHIGMIARADSEPYRARLVHFRLRRWGRCIDSILGVAIEPSKDENAQDSRSTEDLRVHVYNNPMTGREELHGLYTGWNGWDRGDLAQNPPDTQDMHLVSYDFEHFEKRGPIFDDDIPGKGASIVDMVPGEVKVARRAMVGDWCTTILSAPSMEGSFRYVDQIPCNREWDQERNELGQCIKVGPYYFGFLHGVRTEKDSKGNERLVYSAGRILLDEQGRLIAKVPEPDIEPYYDDEVNGIEGKSVVLPVGLLAVGPARNVGRLWIGAGDWNIRIIDFDLAKAVNEMFEERNRIYSLYRFN